MLDSNPKLLAFYPLLGGSLACMVVSSRRKFKRNFGSKDQIGFEFKLMSWRELRSCSEEEIKKISVDLLKYVQVLDTPNGGLSTRD